MKADMLTRAMEILGEEARPQIERWAEIHGDGQVMSCCNQVALARRIGRQIHSPIAYVAKLLQEKQAMLRQIRQMIVRLNRRQVNQYGRSGPESAAVIASPSS